jgi:hypothetical protein
LVVVVVVVLLLLLLLAAAAAAGGGGGGAATCTTIPGGRPCRAPAIYNSQHTPTHNSQLLAARNSQYAIDKARGE